MKITLLGTGSSGGVPLITGDWGACDPKNPKNKRLRACVLIEFKNGKNLLIDASPDLRQQLLSAKVDRIDAILLTHAHADHIGGLDELRQIFVKHKKIIPVYGLAETLKEVKTMYRY
ncbi:MAG TPA: MBL fold metallo-hydrolase, partial [Alphaproteobacteria bacterium]|nr:MBL fold metallo-hydrolase [Alphaproteobacteria bacterium]